MSPAWLNWASTIATVAAVVFAAWSIGQSRRQARENAEMIYRERRIDFDLERLRELAELNDEGLSQARVGSSARLSLRMLGDRYDLPLLRAALDEPDSLQADMRAYAAAPNAQHPAHARRDEIVAAITEALSRRPTDPAVSNR